MSVSDDIVAGNACMSCLALLVSDAGEPCDCGYPVYCHACWKKLPEQMRENGAPYFDGVHGQVFDDEDDDFAAQREADRLLRKEAGERNRATAAGEFAEASVGAEKHGMTLRKHSASHYSLEDDVAHWRHNIYPGNQRLSYDRNRPKAPFLKLPSPWTLCDVVDAAIAVKQKVREATEAK